MRARRQAQWRRGLSLALFAALFTVPLPWAMGALLIVGAARAGLAARRRLRARARRRAQAGGVLLGRDERGRAVWLGDRQLEAHALIVGASGAGKSTTLLRILEDRIARGRPVVAIDMKGSPGFADALRTAANAAGRELRVWTPEGPAHWNPLAHGNPTALKDKLIASERFSEPHYQRAAERYLQTALQVLAAAHPDRAPRLNEVVAAMEPGRLRPLLDRVPEALGERVEGYLDGLTPDQRSAAAGLGTRLALLAESTAGPYLAPADDPRAPVLDLGAALAGGAAPAGGDVVLFSINASVYGKLGAQLGALAIQDLTSAAGRRLEGPAGPGATVALDEFSALGADTVLALLARGREAGVGVLLATQELADLERAAPGFRDQVLGITAVKLAHRQEVPASALTIAQLAGTQRVWRETRMIADPFAVLSRGTTGRGTRREAEEYVVHPNEIKRLATGRVVLLTKVPEARVARTRVLPPSASAGARARGPGPDPPHRRPPDQAAPGVTR